MGLFDSLKAPVLLKDDSEAKAQLTALQELQREATGTLAEKLEEEISRVNAGVFGENTVRFELENSHMPMYVLHDLFLEQNGLSAQIDYLIVTRKLTFVVECKNLYGNIEINNAGDFIRTTNFGRRTVKEGMYSPITQNVRHMEMIKQIRSEAKSNFISKLMFEKYFEEQYKSVVVLANPKTVLNNRYAKKEIRQQVIRVDQLVDFMKKAIAESKNSRRSDKEMEEIAQFFMSAHKSQQKDYTEKYRAMLEEQKRKAAETPVTPVAQEKSATGALGQQRVLCPKCGAAMVKRKVAKGANAGREFYGCSNYPKCRGIVNLI